MIHLACIVIGIYLLINAVYLGSQSDHENRQCMVARYVGAGMSGGYLAWLSLNDLTYRLILESQPHRFISNDAMQILLLLGLTIALFMWPETFYRSINYIKLNKPNWYQWLSIHFKRLDTGSRRLADKVQ